MPARGHSRLDRVANLVHGGEFRRRSLGELLREATGQMAGQGEAFSVEVTSDYV
jgi:hypothetical protein